MHILSSYQKDQRKKTTSSKNCKNSNIKHPHMFKTKQNEWKKSMTQSKQVGVVIVGIVTHMVLLQSYLSMIHLEK